MAPCTGLINPSFHYHMTFSGGPQCAPKAEDFLKQMASLMVQENLGIADGKQFDMAYVTLMGKWRT
eukprot:7528388-Pyramimonas_sp.AAC.2